MSTKKRLSTQDIRKAKALLIMGYGFEDIQVKLKVDAELLRLHFYSQKDYRQNPFKVLIGHIKKDYQLERNQRFLDKYSNT